MLNKNTHSSTHRRARCSAVRTMRSGLLAVAVVFIPKLMLFIEHGVFTRATLKELGQGFTIAALMVVFNYAQRFNEESKRTAQRRTRQAQHIEPEE